MPGLEYHPILPPPRTVQNEALMNLGNRLASNKLSPEDLAALVAEHYDKAQVEGQLGHTASQNIKLPAAPQAPVHH
jgi:hypothetical protein